MTIFKRRTPSYTVRWGLSEPIILVVQVKVKAANLHNPRRTECNGNERFYLKVGSELEIRLPLINMKYVFQMIVIKVVKERSHT